ncbi:IniB N-terminal domain-containing protein [Actinoplanes sp. NPDC004185]
MDSIPTLQDFVLNLIYDPAARSAFELDPETALNAAGLADVTAADVQQVIPLVVDSAPVTGLYGLAGADDLTTGVANLDVAGAVSQLQAITSQVAVMPGQVAGDLNVANTLAGVNATVLTVAGDDVVGGSVLSGNSLGLVGVGGGVTSAVPVGVGGLSAGNDPALHLDNTVVSPVEHSVTSMVSGVDHVAPGVDAGPTGILDGGLGTVTNLPASIPLDHVPDLDVAGVGGATSSVGSLIKPDLGHVLPHDPVHSLDSTLTGVGGAAHDVTSGVLHGVTHPAEDSDASHDLLGGLHP